MCVCSLQCACVCVCVCEQNLAYEIILTLGQAFEVAYQLALQARKSGHGSSTLPESFDSKPAKPVPKPRVNIRKSVSACLSVHPFLSVRTLYLSLSLSLTSSLASVLTYLLLSLHLFLYSTFSLPIYVSLSYFHIFFSVFTVFVDSALTISLGYIVLLYSVICHCLTFQMVPYIKPHQISLNANTMTIKAFLFYLFFCLFVFYCPSMYSLFLL